MPTYKVTHNYTLAKIAYVEANKKQQAQEIADNLLIANPEFGYTDEVIEGVLSYGVYKDFDYVDIREETE